LQLGRVDLVHPARFQTLDVKSSKPHVLECHNQKSPVAKLSHDHRCPAYTCATNATIKKIEEFEGHRENCSLIESSEN